MRMIGQFVKVLAKVLFSKDQNDTEQALAEIKSGFRLVGLNSDIIESFSYPNILVFLRQGDELQIEKCLYMAELSRIYGDIQKGNDDSTHIVFFIVSLGLFTEALKADPSLYSKELSTTIDYLIIQLRDTVLSPEIISNLEIYDTLRDSTTPTNASDTLYTHMKKLINDELGKIY